MTRLTYCRNCREGQHGDCDRRKCACLCDRTVRSARRRDVALDMDALPHLQYDELPERPERRRARTWEQR